MTIKNLTRIRTQLSPARRRKIASRAATLVAEERSLQELRQAHRLTQKRMAELLEIGQDSVSRLEQTMGSAFNVVGRVVSTLFGVITILLGLVWILQAFDMAFNTPMVPGGPVSFMVNNHQWAGKSYRPAPPPSRYFFMF